MQGGPHWAQLWQHSMRSLHGEVRRELGSREQASQKLLHKHNRFLTLCPFCQSNDVKIILLLAFCIFSTKIQCLQLGL